MEQDPGIGRAQVAIAGGCSRDQRVDVRRDGRHQCGGSRHIGVDVLVGHLDRRLALVRLPAGEHLVEEHAGGVHVRTRVGTPIDDQFWCQIGDRADQHAGGGGVLGVGAHGLGQAEVRDLDPAVVGDQHVFRLHVAVDQPRPMCGRERGQHRFDQDQGPRGGHRRLGPDQVAQRVPGDVLHDQVDRALILALVVDTDDVLVGQPGRGARLTDEALGE